MNAIKDILAQSAYTTAVSRLTKAAKKSGVERDEVEAIFAAILKHHYGAALLSAPPSTASKAV